MEHTRLGRTGLKVSRLCLGTMTFGLQIDEQAAASVLDRATGSGVTFIDTADVYPLGGGIELVGRTEEILGRWLKGKRQDFVLATKCFGRTGPQPWDAGNSRRHIMDAVDASLRRLGTDYIDLYQLHQDDPEAPLDETLGALDALVRAGKVRYIGCSNFLSYRLARALGRSETLGLARFDSVQPRYNLLFREFERELFPLCLEEGVGVIPYNPLAGGLLSGKHGRDMPPTPGTRFTLPNAGPMYQERYWHQREFDVVDAFQKTAKEAGLKPATLALAWVLQQP
ncbi:MAG: aldo/keto reductase, partial [Fimbriimonadales bacterium]